MVNHVDSNWFKYKDYQHLVFKIFNVVEQFVIMNI